MAIKEFKLLPIQEKREGDYHMFEFDFSGIKKILNRPSFWSNNYIRVSFYIKSTTSGSAGYSSAQFQDPVIWYYANNYSTPAIGQRNALALSGGGFTLDSRIVDWSIEQLKHVSIGFRALEVEGINEARPPFVTVEYDVYEEKILYSVSIDKVRSDTIEPVTITWESDVQDTFELQYTHDGVTKTITGTTAKNHTFPQFTLQPGVYTWKLRVMTNGGWGSDWVEGTPFEIYNGMKVAGLEPNGVAQNKDKDIAVTWETAHPQKQFELQYTVGEIAETITGGITTQHVFPANTLPISTVNYKVRAYDGYMWSEWVSASFIVFGKPETPTLTIQSEYDTATPTFTWESVGQVSYRLQILKDETIVLDSADVYSSVKEHTFAIALENNVAYIARLSIKNQYEYASDWDIKEFKIVFQELQKPRFDMFGDDNLGRVMFNIYNAEGQTDFAYCELYRREYGKSEWIKIATDLELNSMYTDYTCRSGVLYEYKASAIGLTGGYTDSDIALKEISLRNTMISDTTDYNNYVILIHNPKKSRTFVNEIHLMQYSGLTAPKFEFGDIKYVNTNISFTVDEKTLNKLLDLYYSNNTLLLRDNRGKKIYGHISNEPNVEDAEFMKYTVSFPFTETNFNEGV